MNAFGPYPKHSTKEAKAIEELSFSAVLAIASSIRKSRLQQNQWAICGVGCQGLGLRVRCRSGQCIQASAC